MAKTSITAVPSAGNLNFLTAQKIIHRLLTQERIKTDLDEGRIKGLGITDNKPIVKVAAYTKKGLAKKLGITLDELYKLNSPTSYECMANKISLPLIHLYCATKFSTDEHK